MKISSIADYFEDALRPDGFVLFKGTGSVYGPDTTIVKIKEFPDSCTYNVREENSRWGVEMLNDDNHVFDFDVSDIENHPTWVNTSAGAHIALKEFSGWKKKSSVESFLPAGDEGDILQLIGGVWTPVPLGVAGIVEQTYALTATNNPITLPAGITGNSFLFQTFQIVGDLEVATNLIMHYDTVLLGWYIDLTGFEAMTIKIKFIQ